MDYGGKKGDDVYNGTLVTDPPNKQESDVPPNHARFYCEKCQTVSFPVLPQLVIDLHESINHSVAMKLKVVFYIFYKCVDIDSLNLFLLLSISTFHF